MAEHSGSKAVEDRDQIAAYLAELTSELALVARRHGLDTLGYLLDMARLEAENNVAQLGENGAGRARTTDPKAKVANC